MFFDVRAAKLVQSGQHMVIDGCPGLRLVASATRKSWAYLLMPTENRSTLRGYADPKLTQVFY